MKGYDRWKSLPEMGKVQPVRRIRFRVEPSQTLEYNPVLPPEIQQGLFEPGCFAQASRPLHIRPGHKSTPKTLIMV